MKTMLVLTMLVVPLMAAERLDEHRWKKRVLVVAGGAGEVGKKLSAARGGLAERDVVVYFLDGEGERPGKILAEELKVRLKIKDGADEVVLLGKDGRTTVRWKAEEFDVKRLFGEIDSMPMRQREMEGR